LGSLLLTYVIVRRQARRWAAVGACLLLTCGATQLLISQLARSYTLLQLLATAQVALILAPQRPTAWRLLISALLAAAALFTHGAAQVAIPALLGGVLVALPGQWRYVLAAAAGCLLYAPFAWAFPTIDNVEVHLDWVPPPSVAALLRFPALLQFGRHIHDVPVAVQALAGLVIVGLGVGALLHSDEAACLALQWFFTWALAAAAAGWGLGIVAVERYFGPALVCQAAFMAITVAAIAQRSRWLGAAGCVVLASLSLASAGLYAALPPFTPWRQMAELIQSQRAPGEKVIVASPAVLATPLAYYYEGEAMFIGEAELPLQTDGASGLWICFRKRDAEAEQRIAEQADRLGYKALTRYPLHHGKVLHFLPER
jgi:hypothetical protein